MTDYERVRKYLRDLNEADLITLCKDIETQYRSVYVDYATPDAPMSSDERERVIDEMRSWKDADHTRWRELCIAASIRTDEGVAIIRSRQAITISVGSLLVAVISIIISLKGCTG